MDRSPATKESKRGGDSNHRRATKRRLDAGARRSLESMNAYRQLEGWRCLDRDGHATVGEVNYS